MPSHPTTYKGCKEYLWKYFSSIIIYTENVKNEAIINITPIIKLLLSSLSFSLDKN